MRFLKLTIAYHGGNYAGWQIQPNGNTVQAELESAWTQVTGEQARIVASGRTDAGVHALGQVCSLTTSSSLDTQTLCRALNAKLPDDIRTLNVQTAPVNFHAIRDSIAKTYRYQIQTGATFDLFQHDRCWFVPRSLEILEMTEAAGHLVGKHDFASFQASGAVTKTTVRTIYRLDIRQTNEREFNNIAITIRGDGFLYNMVRNIVGTLVEIGKGKRQPSWVLSIMEKNDRNFAGPTAPAHGLYLVDVEYEAFDDNR